MCKIKCNYQIEIKKENTFVAKIKPKQKVEVETINAYGEKFQNVEEFINLIHCKDGKTHHHPLTGPIYVEGAKPGDILKVHIDRIKTKEMAQSMSKTAGIDPIEKDTLEQRCPVIAKRISKNEIEYANKIKLPFRPMIGMIATMPKEDIIKTGHAKSKNGGNLDLPFVTENVNVYLPVEVEGAGLYLGDVHALQGYGELSGIAMEASSKIVLEVEVIKIKNPLKNIVIVGKEPFSKKECIGIVGIGQKMQIESSIKDAFEGSLKILKALLPNIPQNMAKMLITLIGNLLLGQAYSKTSESTSMIAITKEEIEKITNVTYQNFSQEIEKILF